MQKLIHFPLLVFPTVFSLLEFNTSTDYLEQTFPCLMDPSGLDAQYHR